MAQDNPTKILMVASEATQRELAGILDGAIPFDTADSVDAAKNLIRGHRYQTAIIDEDLPDEGWREIVEFLPEQGIAMPVLISTSEVGGKAIFAESKRDDTFISDVLVRPFSPAVVRARIEAALHAGSSAVHEGATLPSHPLE